MFYYIFFKNDLIETEMRTFAVDYKGQGLW